MTSVIMDIQKLEKKYALSGGFLGGKKRMVHAVDGIDLQIQVGETLGLVGESGCGKSTLGRLLIRLEKPDSGKIQFKDKEISSLTADELKNYRRHVQMIFQDPYSSLNPRKSAYGIISEPLRIHRTGTQKENRNEAEFLMEKVGLTKEQGRRYPHEFSGGQRQRIGIARALALKPQLIIADEPVSALDASIQAQILNLLMDLKKDYGLTYLFVSHDLNVIRHVSDRIAVMYMGRIVELADKKHIYSSPLHPYTRMLLAAMPGCKRIKEKSENIIIGEAGDAGELGCNFRNRCIHKIDICDKVQPQLKSYQANGLCACHRTGDF